MLECVNVQKKFHNPKSGEKFFANKASFSVGPLDPLKCIINVQERVTRACCVSQAELTIEHLRGFVVCERYFKKS